jgi:hypothetical protein
MGCGFSSPIKLYWLRNTGKYLFHIGTRYLGLWLNSSFWNLEYQIGEIKENFRWTKTKIAFFPFYKLLWTNSTSAVATWPCCYRRRNYSFSAMAVGTACLWGGRKRHFPRGLMQ